MTSRRHPPRLAQALIAIALRGELGELVRGDLDEEFHDALANGGSRRAAVRRYWRKAVASIAAARADARSHPHDSGEPRMPRTPHTALSGWTADLRQALRRLAATPAFTAVAIASLAIGIGANTAIATVARAALVTPLAVERPDELALIYLRLPKDTATQAMNSNGYKDPATAESYSSVFSFPLFGEVRAHRPDNVGIAGYTFLRGATVAIEGRPAEGAGGMLVSGNYFDVMKPAIVLGRGLGERDDQPGAEPAVVISHAFWQKAFAANPDVLNRVISINAHPVRVVGVTGPGFQGISRGGFFPVADVTLPFAAQPRVASQWTTVNGSLTANDRLFWVSIVARIPPVTARTTVEDAMNRAARGYLVAAGKIDAAKEGQVKVRAFPGARGLDLLRTSLSQSIGIIAVIAGVILLVACLNIASMMLARGVARQREMSVRRALGATRWQLIRITLIESIVLSMAGAVAGLVLAVWCRDALRAMVTTGLGRVNLNFDFDLTLVATASSIGLVAAIVCGLLPAIRLSRQSPTTDLTTRPGGSTAPHLRLGRALIALQIALSLPMLVGAGLLLRTVQNLTRVEIGFNPDQLVLFTVNASANQTTPDPAGTIATYSRIIERVRSVPGVVSAALVENSLLSGIQSSTRGTIDGRDTSLMMNAIGPQFFDTMGITLLAGRAITDDDRLGSAQRVVINQSAAALFKASPLGQHFTLFAYDRALQRQVPRDVEVIGVVADTKYTSVREPVRPTFYDAFSQRLGGPGALHVVARVTDPPARIEEALRRAVASVSPNVAVSGYTTQVEQNREQAGLERVFAQLLTAFGAIALLLASLGLHGVTSYSVAQRTNEIGIRMALGAQRSQVLRLVLRHVVVLGVVGVMIGLPLAYLTRPLLKTFLFELNPSDPLTFGLSGAIMLAVALVAGLLPARRAASVDPLVALRRD